MSVGAPTRVVGTHVDVGLRFKVSRFRMPFLEFFDYGLAIVSQAPAKESDMCFLAAGIFSQSILLT